MNEATLDGSRIRVDFATPQVANDRNIPPSSTLFLGNLPQTLSDEDVREVLSENFGSDLAIKEIRLIAPRTDQVDYNDEAKNRGFGFIEFGSVDEAKELFEKIKEKSDNGWTLQGKSLKIGYEKGQPREGFARGFDRRGGDDRRGGGGYGVGNDNYDRRPERREYGGGRPTFGRSQRGNSRGGGDRFEGGGYQAKKRDSFDF